jgi:Succinate dehydrogenase/fumarate reductase, cytochrome b subunit
MQNQSIVSTGSVYKGRTGMWLYLFHRITGVALFGYLLLHIISTALILAGPEVYEGAEAIYKILFQNWRSRPNGCCLSSCNQWLKNYCC